MRRGEIYYIARRDTVGSELMKARPGVIVSNDSLNTSSPVVEVVYCTTKPKKDQPTHVEIETTGAPCVVLCEQIDSVSTALVGKRCGTCTDEEMAAIDRALLHSLGLDGCGRLDDEAQTLKEQIEALQAERDRYAKMLDNLLGTNV